jgi:hypothetical protein
VACPACNSKQRVGETLACIANCCKGQAVETHARRNAFGAVPAGERNQPSRTQPGRCMVGRFRVPSLQPEPQTL